MEKLGEMGMAFPAKFIESFFKDIETSEGQLSYHKFAALLDMYYSLPLIKKKDANNSENLKGTLDLYEERNVVHIPKEIVDMLK